ncbi:MAG: hypothetical protein AAF741_10440 [Bacteroidota bacterium]
MNRPPRSSKQPPEHLLGPIRSIYKRRFLLLYLAVGTFVLTFLFTKLFLDEYYEGKTAFIALSPDQSSPDLLFGGQGRAQIFGNANDIDRIMAISQSNELVDYMVETFRLYDHYGIDSTKQRAPMSVRSEFFSLYDVTKTTRDAIEITVQDTSPTLAATMANTARERIGFLGRELQRRAQAETVKSLNNQIAQKYARLVALGDSLAVLRRQSGIYNQEAQSEALGALVTSQAQQIESTRGRILAYKKLNTRASRDSVANLNAKLEGMLRGRAVVDSQLVLLNQSMAAIEALDQERQDLSSQINRDRDRTKQFQTALESEQKAIAVIQAADVPVVKSWPHRSVIVVGLTALVLFVAVLAILISESSKYYPWRDWLKEDE